MKNCASVTPGAGTVACVVAAEPVAVAAGALGGLGKLGGLGSVLLAVLLEVSVADSGRCIVFLLGFTPSCPWRGRRWPRSRAPRGGAAARARIGSCRHSRVPCARQ